MGDVVDEFVDLLSHAFESMTVDDILFDQQRGKSRERISLGFQDSLSLGLVVLFVVGEGVGIGSRAVGVNERGSIAFAAEARGLLHGVIGGEKVGAVDFET